MTSPFRDMPKTPYIAQPSTLTPYYWRCQLGGWSLYLLFYSLAAFISVSLGEETVIRVIVRSTYYLLSLLLGSHILRLWCRHQQWLTLDARGFWQRCFAASLLLGWLIALIIWPFGNVVDQLWAPPGTRNEIMEQMEDSFSFAVVLGGILNAMVLLVWSLVYWAVHIWHHNNQIQLSHQALVISQKNTELDQLRQQLNPHFLFNSLNNIRAMVHIDSDKASDMVTQLAELLRYSLQHANGLVCLKDELAIVECYLSLEKVRLADKLQLQQQLDENSLNCQLPPMLLQSLVENAVKHGISTRRNGGLLTIESCRQATGLQITLSNDGELDNPQANPQANHQPNHRGGLGVGLKNCRQRLALLYGDKASLTLEQQGAKVITHIFIPSDPQEID